MRIIGLTGSKGAGKDTAFLAIREWSEERGLLAVRRGFADKLKLSFARVFYPGIDQEAAIEWCDKIKQNGQFHWYLAGQPILADDQSHGRQMLQNYGTEAHRDVFGLDFWVDQLLPRDEAKMHWGLDGPDLPDHKLPDFLVITDVRFENEAKRIRWHRGQIWKIVRPDVEDGDLHASEAGLSSDFCDWAILNDGSIEVFETRIKSMMTDHYHTLNVKGSL